MKMGKIRRGIIIGIILLVVGAGVVAAFKTNQSITIQPANRSNIFYVGGSRTRQL